MFNKGYIVRCINGKYRYTSYMRPCTVKGYGYLGKLIVEPFNDEGSFYEVEDKHFELVPPTDIIEKGQEIAIHGIDSGKRVELVRYLHNGMIRVKVNGQNEDIDIERIIYRRGLYI